MPVSNSPAGVPARTDAARKCHYQPCWHFGKLVTPEEGKHCTHGEHCPFWVEPKPAVPKHPGLWYSLIVVGLAILGLATLNVPRLFRSPPPPTPPSHLSSNSPLPKPSKIAVDYLREVEEWFSFALTILEQTDSIGVFTQQLQAPYVPMRGRQVVDWQAALAAAEMKRLEATNRYLEKLAHLRTLDHAAVQKLLNAHTDPPPLGANTSENRASKAISLMREHWEMCRTDGAALPTPLAVESSAQKLMPF